MKLRLSPASLTLDLVVLAVALCTPLLTLSCEQIESRDVLHSSWSPSSCNLSGMWSELSKCMLSTKDWLWRYEGGSDHIFWVLRDSLEKVREGVSG